MGSKMGRLALWALVLAGREAVVTAQGQGLHSLAVAAGKLFFGTATDTNHFNDAAYMAIVNDTNQFGLVVPENGLKWESTEPTQGDFTFADGDQVLALAKANKQIFRCHTLTWHSQLPNFVSQGTWTASTLTAVIQSHISHVVGHYAGACYSWDVVNEALGNNGSVESSVFFDTMGETFIPISFTAAAKADPKAKLYYNDFGMEDGGAKADGAVTLVKSLQSQNVRIDGIGLQSHLVVGQSPSRSKFAAVLNQFTALGLEVALTELDIRQMSLPPSDAAVQQQAEDYINAVGACLDVAKCVGVVVWEYTDKYSWIPSTFNGSGSACLWDENLSEKPAYTSVSSLLAAAATGGSAAAPTNGNSLGTGSVAAPTGTKTGTGTASSSASTTGVVAVSQAPARVTRGSVLAAVMAGTALWFTLAL